MQLKTCEKEIKKFKQNQKTFCFKKTFQQVIAYAKVAELFQIVNVLYCHGQMLLVLVGCWWWILPYCRRIKDGTEVNSTKPRWKPKTKDGKSQK